MCGVNSSPAQRRLRNAHRLGSLYDETHSELTIEECEQCGEVVISLSEALGEEFWRESGIGQPGDTGQLRQQMSRLSEENQQLRDNLAERDQDLAAARAASRELMTRLNTRS